MATTKDIGYVFDQTKSVRQPSAMSGNDPSSCVLLLAEREINESGPSSVLPALTKNAQSLPGSAPNDRIFGEWNSTADFSRVTWIKGRLYMKPRIHIGQRLQAGSQLFCRQRSQ
jgi:hypothetical protein